MFSYDKIYAINKTVNASVSERFFFSKDTNFLNLIFQGTIFQGTKFFKH